VSRRYLEVLAAAVSRSDDPGIFKVPQKPSGNILQGKIQNVSPVGDVLASRLCSRFESRRPLRIFVSGVGDRFGGEQTCRSNSADDPSVLFPGVFLAAKVESDQRPAVFQARYLRVPDLGRGLWPA